MLVDKSTRLQLDSILQRIELVDFNELAGIESGKKISRALVEVLVVQYLITVAEELNYGFCSDGSFVYFYNGAYWQCVDLSIIGNFLSDVADRMGYDVWKSKHYLFKKNLVEQFLTSITPASTLGHDKSKTLINLHNGTFEVTLDYQMLRQPSADDFLKYQLDFDYEPNAKAPMFEQYLNRVLPDEDSQRVLSEYMGYVFAKGLKLEKVLILYGSGANGKSVFYEIVNALLGSENVSSYSLDELTKENSYQRANLQNVLLNYSSEINGKLEASVFKQLASNENVSARQIYGQPFTMTDYGRLMFNCNELPKEIEQTDAFFRRFIIIPFSVVVPVEERDPYLSKKIIQNELSGVFNWVLEGLYRLLKNRSFTDSELLTQQLYEFCLESDSVRMFIDDCHYEVSPEYMEIKKLYVKYQDYCVDTFQHPVSYRKFPSRLRSLGYCCRRMASGYVVYLEHISVIENRHLAIDKQEWKDKYKEIQNANDSDKKRKAEDKLLKSLGCRPPHSRIDPAEYEQWRSDALKYVNLWYEISDIREWLWTWKMEKGSSVFKMQYRKLQKLQKQLSELPKPDGLRFCQVLRRT